MASSLAPEESCPFCAIAAAYPYPPSALSKHQSTSSSTSSSSSTIGTDVEDSSTTVMKEAGSSGSITTSTTATAHMILSTKHVLAFLDIMPLTRGHVLLVTRDHFEKLEEVSVRVSREVGMWLPIISRVIMKTLFGSDAGDHHWNVVQNNGVRAAQQVPHVHFHIIPRPPLDSAARAGRAATTSFVMFGRGLRDELDDEDGEDLARSLRRELASQVARLKRDGEIDLDGDVQDVDSRFVSKSRPGKL